MPLDATSIGLLGLVFAGLSVLATFVAPRLVGHSRLHFEQGLISRLRHKQELGEIRIAVTRNGADVGGEIYLASGKLVNSGSKDISIDNFVDPILLNVNGPFELLSFDCSAESGIGVDYSRDVNSGKLTWRILKPKEFISVRFIISSKSEIKKRRYRNLVSPVIRLRDVKTGRVLSSKLRVRQFFITLIVLAVIGSVPLGIVIFKPVNAVVVSQDGYRYRVRLTDENAQLCKLSDKQFYISKCNRVDAQRLSSLSGDASFEKVYVGVRIISALIISLVVLLYSAMITFSSQSFLRSWRMITRRENVWDV